MQCSCCDNRVFVDTMGTPVTEFSERVVIVDLTMIKCDKNHTETRVTLTVESARELIADLQAAFGHHRAPEGARANEVR